MANIVETIKKAALEAVENSKPLSYVFGTVIGTAPLKIQVDQKLILTKEFLILTKGVIDYKTEISINSGDKQSATIYNGLKQGEKVQLVRVQGGQKFVVLDKVVG